MKNILMLILVFLLLICGLAVIILSLGSIIQAENLILFLIIISAAGFGFCLLFSALELGNSLIQPLYYIVVFALTTRLGGILLYLVPGESLFFPLWFPLNDPGLWGFLLITAGCIRLLVHIESKVKSFKWYWFLCLLLLALPIFVILWQNPGLWPLIYLVLAVCLIIMVFILIGLIKNKTSYRIFLMAVLLFISFEYARLGLEAFALPLWAVLSIAVQPGLALLIVYGLILADRTKKGGGK